MSTKVSGLKAQDMAKMRVAYNIELLSSKNSFCGCLLQICYYLYKRAFLLVFQEYPDIKTHLELEYELKHASI